MAGIWNVCKAGEAHWEKCWDYRADAQGWEGGGADRRILWACAGRSGSRPWDDGAASMAGPTCMVYNIATGLSQFNWMSAGTGISTADPKEA